LGRIRQNVNFLAVIIHSMSLVESKQQIAPTKIDLFFFLARTQTKKGF